MVRILGLQRAHQNFKFRKTEQILETRVLQKKWPARKSAADTPLKPFKGRRTPLQQRKDTSDLIVGMVGMSKGFCAAAGASQALERRAGLARQSIVDTEQTD